MKKKFSLILLLLFLITNVLSCNIYKGTVAKFDRLDDITDSSLYKDATTLKYNIIKFGKQNGQDISWYVVESYSNYRVLLCEKVLDLIPYNDTYFDVNFEDSSLYRYLENDFLKQYFSNQEIKDILTFTDGLKVNIPTLDNLKEYFGDVTKATAGYYGDESNYSPNKEMVAKPAESSDNEALVNNVFDNHLFANKNNVDIDIRYNFADGCQPYWIYDGNELYVNYVTATGYVARTNQNNKYIGFRPIIKVRK